MKVCKQCNQELESKMFYANPKSKDGLNTHCKECSKRYSREQYVKIKADPILYKKNIARITQYYKDLKEGK